MVSGEVKKGNIRRDFSISKEADQILRLNCPSKGQMSQKVDELIKKEYKQKEQSDRSLVLMQNLQESGA